MRTTTRVSQSSDRVLLLVRLCCASTSCDMRGVSDERSESQWTSLLELSHLEVDLSQVHPSVLVEADIVCVAVAGIPGFSGVGLTLGDTGASELLNAPGNQELQGAQHGNDAGSSHPQQSL